jgi:hypothetical protein
MSSDQNIPEIPEMPASHEDWPAEKVLEGLWNYTQTLVTIVNEQTRALDRLIQGFQEEAAKQRSFNLELCHALIGVARGSERTEEMFERLRANLGSLDIGPPGWFDSERQ